MLAHDVISDRIAFSLAGRRSRGFVGRLIPVGKAVAQRPAAAVASGICSRAFRGTVRAGVNLGCRKSHQPPEISYMIKFFAARLAILRCGSDVPNMLAVAAPAETLASALEVTRAPEGHAVDLARVAGAVEFMDAGR